MKQQLRSYVLETFMYGASPDQLDDDVSLLDTGIIDSTSVLELVLYLEQQYGVSVDASELTPANLESINRIEAFLLRKGVAVGA
jgi:acyl carrier protein